MNHGQKSQQDDVVTGTVVATEETEVGHAVETGGAEDKSGYQKAD